jgi:hypothetical protein
MLEAIGVSRAIKSTRAPNGADRGKYNAYQREYKRRRREAVRADGDGGVLGDNVQRADSADLVAGVAGDAGARDAAELGYVPGLQTPWRVVH